MAIKMEFSEFYLGKKILITGHTGFKGSWLLLWLKSLGAIVKGYSLAPDSDRSLYNLIDGDELCESVIADVRNYERFEREILSFEPDIIFHMAAQPLVRLSYNLPKETFETNFNGTLNLLEALKKFNKKCSVVVVTTDKVYENLEKNYAYKENDKLGGYDPYSASKAAAELVVSSYKNSFFNINNYPIHIKSIATARAGNVIGGGDRSANRLIPDIVESLEKGIPIEVRNPSSIRPWQFVLEPLGGYMTLGMCLYLDPYNTSSSFNFGPDPEDVLTVEQLVENAIIVWGGGHFNIKFESSKLHEAQMLMLDNKKAKDDLGVYPKYSSKEAIEKTIMWYKEAEVDYRKYSVEQINKFCSG